MGYFNVRLQNIADLAQMSVGNMAYHYQHKTEMFQILYNDWRKKQDFILAEIHLTPIFENFSIYLEQTFALQQEYRFVYLDQLELIRMSSNVENIYREYFQNHEEQLAILLALYHARGVMELKEVQYDAVATRLRRAIDSWMMLQYIEGKDMTKRAEFQACVWSELKPFLTASGWEEFEEKSIEITI